MTLTGKPPIIIGHRGASGYRPEHTLAAYELAIELGVNYIEPDLVSTKDGVLVARHENNISQTTNVSTYLQFASRQTTKIINGVSITGWFTEDFTLAELKTLRAKERLPFIRTQNTKFDNLYEIPTLQEIIDLVKQKKTEKGYTIGIYPETKYPSYFCSIGLALEEQLLKTLEINGYLGKEDPVFIQSFEVENLKKLAQITNVSLVQLLNDIGRPYDFVVKGEPRTYTDLITPAGLAEIATYAQAIGVNKNLLIPRDKTNNLLTATTLINDAHKQNLQVHAWTFRNENVFLPVNLPNNPEAEYERFFHLDIDGVFSDNPDTALAVRTQFLNSIRTEQ